LAQVLCYKYQYKYQYFACKYKYQYKYSKNILKYNLSTSTSTKYNKTGHYFKKLLSKRRDFLATWSVR